ncbi:hypothetical protein NESM_000552900 [Novymonas esmeraldas]|uniref:Uncharacterized protein n=1 Tax=Novymonas esmeraldas TaxID=1808958 RepID=A0AAW0EQ73_9TRYP
MPRIPTTRLFQAYCAGAVLFEVPIMVQLVREQSLLPAAGAWVDDKAYYKHNKPLAFVFLAIVVCLVVARAMACALPKSRVIIGHLVATHLFEAVLFFYCCMHKEDAPSTEVYVLGVLITWNVALFAARLIQLRAQQASAEVANLKWRQEQLAIIRKKRADYAKSKEDKKKN